MKKKLAIAVTQRIEVVPERGENRDSLDSKLIEWITYAGFTPFPIPNFDQLTAAQSWLAHVNPHAIILSGGDDLDLNSRRDRLERFLIEYAESHRMPILALCRGMQALAVHCGSQLVSIPNHVGTRHVLQSTLDDCWPNTVNSYHNFAIAECPGDFDVGARTADGVIEAIVHRFLPWEGWMWHPEREEIPNDIDIRRLHGITEFRPR